MKRNIRVFLAISCLTILLLAGACSPTSAPPPEEGGESPAVTEQTSGEVEEETTGEEVPQTEAVPAENPSGVPEDVPIMEGARNLQVTGGGKNITYQVDGEIADVVGFYQDQLPNYGWESAGNPDTVVARIATLLRQNANEDRISVNMQHNELGGFVVLTITISRQ